MDGVLCPLCGSENARPLLQVLARRMLECQKCGLIYRHLQSTVAGPPPASAADQTASLREERVGERRSPHFSHFLNSAGRPGKLLDVGCGYGFFLKLAHATGWEATGVDLDPQAVEYAISHLQVDARLGDVQEFAFPERSFDLVTCWNVLECVTDPFALLKEIHRVLKPGGRVFIRTQNATWQLLSFRFTSLLKQLGWRAVFEKRPYLTFIFNMTSFSPVTLRFALERAGFASVSVKNSPPIQGDPYVGLKPTGELLLSSVKRAVQGVAAGVAFLSRAHLLVGPSLECWAYRAREST